jgi:hypothetical protein
MRVCLLLQDLLQSCSCEEVEVGIVEDMCYERRRLVVSRSTRPRIGCVWRCVRFLLQYLLQI